MKHTFFVIEDHALTNLGIREILQENTDLKCAGFASSEPEAFEKLTELDVTGSLPEVLVLDLFLGEYSGIDILREVNRHFPSINIVVYSMYSNPGIISIVLENGAKGFVSKASSEEELVTAIKEICSGKTYIQQSLIERLHTYTSILESLTKSEQSVLKKLLERKNINQIAEALNMDTHTVDSYLSRIRSKTGCRNNEELIAQFG